MLTVQCNSLTYWNKRSINNSSMFFFSAELLSKAENGYLFDDWSKIQIRTPIYCTYSTHVLLIGTQCTKCRSKSAEYIKYTMLCPAVQKPIQDPLKQPLNIHFCTTVNCLHWIWCLKVYRNTHYWSIPKDTVVQTQLPKLKVWERRTSYPMESTE